MPKKFLPQKLKYGTRDGKGAIARYGRGRSDTKHGNLEQEILWKSDCGMIGQAAAG